MHNKYFDVMKAFLGNYSLEVYGRGLVKKVKISQKNIALTLEELEKAGILSSKTRGNARHYSLNKNNPLIRKYIILAEIENSLEFLKKHPKISQILSKIDSNQIICIFGSYSKGIETNDSDLDLLIVGQFDETRIKSIGEDYNLKISIKKCSETEFISSLKAKSPLLKEILENHVIISGYEEFVNLASKWQV